MTAKGVLPLNAGQRTDGVSSGRKFDADGDKLNRKRSSNTRARNLLNAAALIGGTIVAASAVADASQGGYGPGYGMGPGAMGGYGPRSDLNLSAEQRGQIARIQDEVRRKHWDLMGKMQEEQSLMFDLSLSAREQIDAVLTKEQREKQRPGG